MSKSVVPSSQKMGFWNIIDDETGLFFLSPGGRPIETRNYSRAIEIAKMWDNGTSSLVPAQDTRRENGKKILSVSVNPDVLASLQDAKKELERIQKEIEDAKKELSSK